MKILKVKIHKDEYKKRNCLTCKFGSLHNNGCSCQETNAQRWDACCASSHHAEYKPFKTLKLVLTYDWFDKIKSGEKTKEFRAVKPFFNEKFQYGQVYEKVQFQRGYTNPERMTFEIKSIRKSYNEPNDLNLPEVWVIDLGQRIQEEGMV